MDNQDPEEVVQAMFPDPEDESGESERFILTPKQNRWILDKVRNLADRLGELFKISRKGVPYIVVRCIATDKAYSIVYFKRMDVWRVFYPFMEFDTELEKFDLKSEQEVLDFFENVPR